MPSVGSTVGRPVVMADGAPVGRISAVLFHPAEPRVIGLQVEPAPILYVLSRRPRFVRITDVHDAGDTGYVVDRKRLESEDAAERALGYSWHDTVVWQGMPVSSLAGDPVGVIHDVAFDEQSGDATLLVVSTGVFGDAALGRLEVDGELVVGFDGERVVVKPGYSSIRATGGVAKHAAAGVAVVKVRSGQVAASALEAGTAAATALGRSFRSGLGRRALDKMRSLMDEEE